MNLEGQEISSISQSNSSLRGYIFVFSSVMLWGGSASLAKYLFAKQYGSVIIVQTRLSFSFILLVAYFVLMNRSVFLIRLRDIPLFAGVGILGIAWTSFAYYFTIKESTVATAILIQNTAPVFVMIYAVIVSKEEEFNGIKVLSLLLALTGCYLALSGGSLGDIRLSGWALVTGPGSTLGYAFILIANKKLLRAYSVWTVLVYTFGFAALFWFCINPPWAIAAQGYTINDWEIFLIFAVVSILIPYTFFNAGLKMLEASTVGIISTLEPVTAIIIAYVSLGETLSEVQIAGAAAVVLAVIILQMRREFFRKLLRGILNAK